VPPQFRNYCRHWPPCLKRALETFTGEAMTGLDINQADHVELYGRLEMCKRIIIGEIS
jgi:hypothetical protein